MTKRLFSFVCRIPLCSSEPFLPSFTWMLHRSGRWILTGHSVWVVLLCRNLSSPLERCFIIKWEGEFPQTFNCCQVCLQSDSNHSAIQPFSEHWVRNYSNHASKKSHDSNSTWDMGRELTLEIFTLSFWLAVITFGLSRMIVDDVTKRSHHMAKMTTVDFCNSVLTSQN